MRAHLVLLATLSLSVALGPSGPALAHARLLEETPAHDSILSTAPTELRLNFSEEFEPALTGVTVTDATAATIAIGAPTIAAGDETALLVPLAAPLRAGVYTVYWHAVAKDGHRTNGSYSFSVK